MHFKLLVLVVPVLFAVWVHETHPTVWVAFVHSIHLKRQRPPLQTLVWKQRAHCAQHVQCQIIRNSMRECNSWPRREFQTHHTEWLVESPWRVAFCISALMREAQTSWQTGIQTHPRTSQCLSELHDTEGKRRISSPVSRNIFISIYRNFVCFDMWQVEKPGKKDHRYLSPSSTAPDVPPWTSANVDTPLHLQSLACCEWVPELNMGHPPLPQHLHRPWNQQITRDSNIFSHHSSSQSLSCLLYLHASLQLGSRLLIHLN